MTFDARPVPVFDVEAHRGGAGLWPENTLEAFGRALALGVSTLELDVHLTAEDDVVVVRRKDGHVMTQAVASASHAERDLRALYPRAA